MKAYLINLPNAKARLAHSAAQLQSAGIPMVRIEAVLGKALNYPHPLYDDKGYLRRQGRRRIDAEVGCYLSHIKAIERFLESDDAFGLIVEDDIQLPKNLKTIIDLAIKQGGFDMLRLSTVNTGRWTKTLALDDTYHLGVSLTREKGAGAYLINRKMARKMVDNYLPMRMPFDLRFDLEWFDGCRTLGVKPVPVRQEGFETQIQTNLRTYYEPAKKRYWSVMPYRVSWEIMRFFYRLASWLKLAILRK